MSADPDLLTTWVHGWALTRGAPSPVRDGEAWRVDVNQPDQIARYVYPDATDAVAERAAAIDRPFILLKICADAGAVRPLLGDRWALQPPGFMMTLSGTMGVGNAPPGYRFEARREGVVTFVQLMDEGGEEAARGRATVVDGRIIFDRIATAPAHQRRGLASAVMRALETLGRDQGGRDGVLVATEAGRALYERLGWRLHSPYTTAVIPG